MCQVAGSRRWAGEQQDPGGQAERTRLPKLPMAHSAILLSFWSLQALGNSTVTLGPNEQRVTIPTVLLHLRVV